MSREDGWGDSEADRSGAGVKTLVPHRDCEICQAECKRTGEMHRVSPAELMSCCKQTGSSLDVGGQLDRTHRCPEPFPVRRSRRRLRRGQVVVALGGCERCADLGIGESTRQGYIARVPQGRGDV